MASSDNQGLQIALIIFVVLTLILSVTTFLFFRQYEEAVQKAAQNAKDAANANAAARSTQDEIAAVREMVGFQDTDTLEIMQQTYTDDMAEYAGTLPAEQQTYRALDAKVQTIADVNARLGEEKTKVAELATQLQAIQGAAQTQIAEFQGNAKAADDKAVAAIQKIDTVVKDTTAANSKAVQVFDQAVRKVNASIKSLEDENARSQAELAKAGTRIEDLITVVREGEVKGEFERPDGQVVRVDPANGTVWINLGRADALPRQTTFGVYDEGTFTFDQAKGEIEVTRIILDHLAEARILGFDLENPILEGDRIYSAAWKKGRQVHFALAGWMDINEDGISDRSMIRHLIKTAGGVIDYEVDDEGDVHGNMNIRTRYLVRGSMPTVGEAEAQAGEGAKAVDNYKKALREADELKMEQVSLEKFLDLVGFNQSTNTLQYANPKSSPNFKGPTPDGGRNPVQTERFSERFRQRRPPQDALNANRER